MSISLGILQKVLQWNKRRLCLLALAVIAFIPLFAQNGTVLAVLERGPLLKKVIPFIGPNTLSYYYGEYRLEQEKKAEIYYITEMVPLSSWTPYSCGGLAFLEVPYPGARVLYYSREEGEGIFFLFPGGMDNPCRFINPFLERYTYFRSLARLGGQVTFPAVFEIPGQ